MKHYIPEDVTERLEQLNQWFTDLLFSEDFFNNDKWLHIRLNISKWKTDGYDFVQNYQPTESDFDDSEQLIVFQILHAIAESLLFDHEIRVVATKQNFELAALLRDLKKDALQAFTQNGKENQVVIPFFSFNNKVLTLKFVDNYFINQTIRERLRL
jgi:hypothetical protein